MCAVGNLVLIFSIELQILIQQTPFRQSDIDVAPSNLV